MTSMSTGHEGTAVVYEKSSRAIPVLAALVWIETGTRQPVTDPIYSRADRNHDRVRKTVDPALDALDGNWASARDRTHPIVVV